MIKHSIFSSLCLLLCCTGACVQSKDEGSSTDPSDSTTTGGQTNGGQTDGGQTDGGQTSGQTDSTTTGGGQTDSSQTGVENDDYPDSCGSSTAGCYPGDDWFEDTSTGMATTGAPDEPLMVECNGVMCQTGQVCVAPPEYCSLNENNENEVVDPPPACADMPAECAGLTGDAQEECMIAALCKDPTDDGFGLVGTMYDMGQLDCGAAWVDCF